MELSLSYSLETYLKSSLHCTFTLSFCSFSYNGVCYNGLEPSVSDIIVSQKSSKGDRKLLFFGWDYNFIHILCAKIRIRLEIGISTTTILGFQYCASTRLRYQWFGNHLDHKPRMGTPIR